MKHGENTDEEKTLNRKRRERRLAADNPFAAGKLFEAGGNE
jgi:hypothetical protein